MSTCWELFKFLAKSFTIITSCVSAPSSLSKAVLFIRQNCTGFEVFTYITVDMYVQAVCMSQMLARLVDNFLQLLDCSSHSCKLG